MNQDNREKAFFGAEMEELYEDNEKINEELAAYTISDRFKRNMNRVFREQVGIKDNIPHPEVDNMYERIRSGVIRFFLKVANSIKNKLNR